MPQSITSMRSCTEVLKPMSSARAGDQGQAFSPRSMQAPGQFSQGCPAIPGNHPSMPEPAGEHSRHSSQILPCCGFLLRRQLAEECIRKNICLVQGHEKEGKSA